MSEIHDKLAKSIPKSILECEKCGHKITSPKSWADYLENGWPKHCGYTMTLKPIKKEES